ncbi:fibroblast growth factor 11-like [Lagenorhynchus albirostris]|uniref:fibroblast growth factor 11-like n=1 Tax=Lagenorhynchus albirostris TaxID=27610 RepID=UPI0028E648C3|nr:fibroblast growth factor 11-like [Lagenorhynchus albirostris]
MAALASSLIRQKREVHGPGGSRPVSVQRRVCPRGTKSLCQKQLLILLSKVRLCGGGGPRDRTAARVSDWGGVSGPAVSLPGKVRPGTRKSGARLTGTARK